MDKLITKWFDLCSDLEWCEDAMERCAIHEIGTWVRAIDYCHAALGQLEAWM